MSAEMREKTKKEEEARRDWNSFIHHKGCLRFLPPVIPHDLGGFSLRSKALRDKTVQIEFDSYRLLYSAINLVFAIETQTAVLTLAVFILYNFKIAAFFILFQIPFNLPGCLFLLRTMKIKKRISFSHHLNAYNFSTPAVDTLNINPKAGLT